MSSTYSSQNLQSARDRQIRAVVLDVAERRGRGEPVTDEEICASYPELLPELLDQLANLRRITEAVARADERWGSQDTIAIDWAPSDRRVPERIGRYQVQELLGQGGYGCVYRAWDEELARFVAVKIPQRSRLADAQDVTAYLAEARVLAKLDHPAIVPVYDFGRTDDGGCFVVSKLIEGDNLCVRLEAAPFSHDEAARIVAVAAEALHEAHRQGVVHRDIKPANILLDSQNRVFVTDFGLALHDDERTERKSFAGTPAYMSPEQARGEAHRVDCRSDVFSLGVVLYEMLTGRKPFTGQRFEELLEAIVRCEPLPVHHWVERIPVELERICLKAIARRAADRHPTARHLAMDLRHYLAYEVGESPEILETSSRDSEPTILGPVEVVPKGLRSFDANDAEFFLDLLPGPRDRHGVPESIRQWILRIESAIPDEAFSVGVMYGPSGCGKSSLVRAGLLPRLDPRIHSLYLEATPDDTESQLRRRLLREFVDLRGDTDLAACLAAIRRGQVLPHGAKLLVVVDQFEQWLFGKDEQQRRPLVDALRQCDGEHLQCLLLVRDDFWLALSRFLGELEIDLIQGRNAALVDLFDLPHARKVLVAFGRAYGQLPKIQGGLSLAQDAFLEQAVASLAEEGKVIPVRLALFAEMVKHRPWLPETLRALGGAAGVGVAFLQETFSAPSANPQNRLHQAAARKVLDALLPARGSQIKGYVRSQLDLLDISGYGDRPRAFRELLRILDSDTRLITPSDRDGRPDGVAIGNGADAGETRSGQGHVTAHQLKYFQLTHDYLVPSLREWLTKEQQSSRAGRAELRLAERCAMWSAYPERRQLPSLGEWWSIRWLTRPAAWTSSQRNMMRAAFRHHAWMTSVMGAMLAVVFLAAAQMSSQTRLLSDGIRAQTATAWLALGQSDAIWPLLKSAPDPAMRHQIIDSIRPWMLNPEDLLARIAREDDVELRRAMLLVAGKLAGAQLRRAAPEEAHDPRSYPLIQGLLRLYEEDSDPGVHSAAEWALRQYEQNELLARSQSQLISAGARRDRQWYITDQGHTMMVISGPVHFTMGSSSAEPRSNADEPSHKCLIPRSYSIACKEVTHDQFEPFLRDHPEYRASTVQTLSVEAGQPVVLTTWYTAVAYCDWLSGLAGIPESERCYEPNEEGRFADGMRVAPNFLDRHGFRLPTDAEWEYACRAGVSAPWSSGSDANQLIGVAVFGKSPSEQPLPVGRRLPNDFGLFDMHGNVAEWVHDRYQPFRSGLPTSWYDTETIRDAEERVIRGGSFQDSAAEVRSASRYHRSPRLKDMTVGFRVARSFP